MECQMFATFLLLFFFVSYIVARFSENEKGQIQIFVAFLSAFAVFSPFFRPFTRFSWAAWEGERATAVFARDADFRRPPVSDGV